MSPLSLLHSRFSSLPLLFPFLSLSLSLFHLSSLLFSVLSPSYESSHPLFSFSFFLFSFSLSPFSPSFYFHFVFPLTPIRSPSTTHAHKTAQLHKLGCGRLCYPLHFVVPPQVSQAIDGWAGEGVRLEGAACGRGRERGDERRGGERRRRGGTEPRERERRRRGRGRPGEGASLRTRVMSGLVATPALGLGPGRAQRGRGGRQRGRRRARDGRAGVDAR